MTEWLTGPIKESILTSRIVIVADTETTGLSPDKGASLLEIGAVKIDVEEKKVISSFSSMIMPRITGRVPQKITEITGITNQDIVGAPSEEYVMQQFSKFTENYPMIFHNAIFDWRFLSGAFERVGKHPVNDIIDTVRMSKYLHPDLKKHNLDVLTTYYGHKIEGHHRAVVDAKYTASLYMKMREELIEKEKAEEVQTQITERAPIPMLKADTIRIIRISPWSKRDQKRVYIYTNVGTFCYDHTNQKWFVVDMRTVCNIDLPTCTRAIMNCIGCDSESDLMLQYAS